MNDERFPKASRLRKRGEYLSVQRSHLRYVTPHFIVYARAIDQNETRIGITVSRKVGRAVQRNRVKRLVREAFRRNRSRLPHGLNLVFVARKGRRADTYQDVETELLSAVNELKARVKKRAHKRRRSSQ